MAVLIRLKLKNPLLGTDLWVNQPMTRFGKKYAGVGENIFEMFVKKKGKENYDKLSCKGIL